MPPHITTEPKTAAQADKAPSLLDRVAAWWASDDGHYLADLNAKNYNKDKDIHVDANKSTLEEWTDQRVQILEILWGAGTRLPGDDDFNFELFNHVPLDNKSKNIRHRGGAGQLRAYVGKK